MNAPPLYGLILIGGQSTRMGTDKSLLKYHNTTQREHLYKLLSNYCEKVFFSCNEEQSKQMMLPYIIDNRCEGPITGILSAYKSHSDTSWLVVACDMPYLDKDIIEKLISSRSTENMATCFSHQVIEPLCSIWEPSGLNKLEEFYRFGKLSPRNFLQQNKVNAIHIDAENAKQLVNVNRPEN